MLDAWELSGTVEGMPVADDIAAAPSVPGSYQFLDEDGRALYVGKAKRLHDRLTSYLRPQDPRIKAMVTQSDRVEWVVVPTEAEALLLEASLIAKLQPPYNIRLREAEGYPYVALVERGGPTRVQIWRGPARKGVQRFGPFAGAGQARALLDVIMSSWGVRSCKDSKYKEHQRRGRACLLGDIGRCSGPCVGRVDAAEHGALVDGAVALLSGRTGPTEQRLEQEMRQAAAAQRFEEAARARDRLAAVRSVSDTRTVAASTSDLDVVGWSSDAVGTCVQILCVRHGSVVGCPTVVADRGLDGEPVDVVQVLAGWYASEVAGREVVLAGDLAGADGLARAVSERVGRRTNVTVARRGRRRELALVAETNAAEALRRARLRRAGDAASRRQELVSLADALGLAEPPLRIECFDISHHQGAGTAAGMSVLDEGVPRKARYRSFTLAGHGGDDYAAMGEALKRRMARLTAGDVKFGERPGLVLIDGGPNQLAVAVAARDAAGVDVPMAALSKQLEEVWLEGSSQPVRLAYDSPALYLLQRARDEAHNTALAAGRRLRSRALVAHPLEGVAGLGPKRRERLVKVAGSMAKLRCWDRDRYRQETWLPEAAADAVWSHLHQEGCKTAASSADGPRSERS
jgi:excinuclease ABC subunit C